MDDLQLFLTGLVDQIKRHADAMIMIRDILKSQAAYMESLERRIKHLEDEEKRSRTA